MFLVENGYLPSAGVTQLVECDLAKVDVAGSNPVSRSNPKQNRTSALVSQRNKGRRV
jgi:hypothetical protein